MAGRRYPPPLEDRFWAKVNKTEGCWLWTASGNGLGYGQFWNGERLVYAHRWAYEHWRESIPAGLGLDHLCRTPACVNPWHLEPVTQSENSSRSPLVALNGENCRSKTHCLRGHSLADAYITPKGRRQCRECQRERGRRYLARREG